VRGERAGLVQRVEAAQQRLGLGEGARRGWVQEGEAGRVAGAPLGEIEGEAGEVGFQDFGRGEGDEPRVSGSSQRR
jgi:hypothetical protein